MTTKAKKKKMMKNKKGENNPQPVSTLELKMLESKLVIECEKPHLSSTSPSKKIKEKKGNKIIAIKIKM